jgi:hypothetical protein
MPNSLSSGRENLKSCIALTGCDVPPVRYEQCSYISEEGILGTDRRENLKSYVILTGWAP